MLSGDNISQEPLGCDQGRCDDRVPEAFPRPGNVRHRLLPRGQQEGYRGGDGPRLEGHQRLQRRRQAQPHHFIPLVRDQAVEALQERHQDPAGHQGQGQSSALRGQDPGRLCHFRRRCREPGPVCAKEEAPRLPRDAADEGPCVCVY